MKLQAAKILPLLVAVGALAVLAWWLVQSGPVGLRLRNPGEDQAAGASSAGGLTNAVLAGKLSQFAGKPADLPGAWPGFRGADRDGISKEKTSLAKGWGPAGPKQVWALEVGEGYAAPVVQKGRVYLMDYDQTNRQDALRCFSLADGKEIWRYAYPVVIKRYHGISRTIPFVTEKEVVGIGPKCHVVCLDALTGELRWGFDMVRQYGTAVPEWYTGQCPLVDNGRVILAPGGTNSLESSTGALLAAVDLETGKNVWQTPNANKWLMTHSSVMPMEFAGQRMYVYCASLGVVGVSAKDGALLWQTTDWKISFANVPSPLTFPDGRIFLSGGYGAGSLMIQLHEQGGRIVVSNVFKLEQTVFGATQQTPIFYKDHIYGVRPDGQFVCLDLAGKVLWNSTSNNKFGLGPYFIANDTIFALSETGTLSLMRASSGNYQLLAQASLLKGHEAWGPMALADKRLLARNLTRLACFEVGEE